MAEGTTRLDVRTGGLLLLRAVAAGAPCADIRSTRASVSAPAGEEPRGVGAGLRPAIMFGNEQRAAEQFDMTQLRC